MHCREAEQLIAAGVVETAPARRAALEQHLAACPACARRAAALAEATAAWRAAAGAPVPPADEAWRDFRRAVAAPPPARRRVPLAWLAAPLAAAAALALAFLVWAPREAAPAATMAAAPEGPPHAEFVEVPDAAASTVVFVDEPTGWLVVWAVGAAEAPAS